MRRWKTKDKIWEALKIAGLRRSAPVCAGLRRSVPVCAGLRRSAPVHSENFGNEKILVLFCWKKLVSFSLSSVKGEPRTQRRFFQRNARER